MILPWCRRCPTSPTLSIFGKRRGKPKLTAYLSSKDVARIKVGDSVRYTTTHDAKNQLFLDSTITSIDATATKTEKGNFFKIEAETNLTSEQAERLRYGWKVACR